MRTTVTIDPDTEILLQEEVQRTGRSFKEVLNLAIRQALTRPGEARHVQPIFPAPFPSLLEEQSANRLADALDDERTLQELGS